MNVYKLLSANNLETGKEELVPVPGKRRIRVTKVLVGNDDALIFGGKKRVEYPRILGRFAVGVIADDEDGTYPKGTRVLLHSYEPEEDTGTAPLDLSHSGLRICGQDTDGFLRDFVYADRNGFTPLPDSVNDEKALLIQHVALAKAAVEALNPHKGDHIAVVGGDILGVFICQLLIYRQVSPLLIDGRKDRLDFARSCGIYYTSPADETMLENIANVTGGRLADGVVYSIGAGMTDVQYAVCAHGKNIVYCGLNADNLSLELNNILTRQLSVYGVMDGTEYIETAINLAANKAVNLSAFHANIFTPEKLKGVFQEYLKNPVQPINETHIVNLL